MQNPKLAPKDNVWTLQHFPDVVETSPDLQRWTRPAQPDKGFLTRSTFAVTNTLWSQLMRASEILPSTGAPARAAQALWNLADVTFHSTDGSSIPILDSGVPDPSRAPDLAFVNLRMVPSKADKHATNPPLRFPMPSAPTERALSPCAYFWDLFTFHPLPRIQHDSTPLFASSISSRSSRLTERDFMKQWKAFCTAAGMPFKFGKHAFRRGGINRLIDIGCSAPVIAALGRWKSDVWQIYARRNKEQLITVTAAMTVPNLSPPTFLFQPLPNPTAAQNPSVAHRSWTPSLPEESSAPSRHPLAPAYAHQPTWTHSSSNAPASALSRPLPAPAQPRNSFSYGEDLRPCTVLTSRVSQTKISQISQTQELNKFSSTASQRKGPTPLLTTHAQTSSTASQPVQPAKVLLQLPSSVVLQTTSKKSSAAHINGRCQAAHGLSIRQTLTLRVNNKDRVLSKYSITDIRYDLLRGFLTLLSPDASLLPQQPHPFRRCRSK